jgi:hypothetical protein
MADGRSIRRLAAELGVTQRTVARWRRRVLAGFAQEPTRRLAGVVEVMPFRPVGLRHIHLMAAVDGDGRAVALLLPRWPTAIDVAAALQRFVAPGSHVVLSAAVGRRAFRRGAEAAGFTPSVAEVARARIHARALTRWLRRFHGTRHLGDYVAWFNARHATLDVTSSFAAHVPALSALPCSPPHVSHDT